jgi:hypothetical protein
VAFRHVPDDSPPRRGRQPRRGYGFFSRTSS